MTQFNNSLTIPTLLQQRSEELSAHCALRFLHNGGMETDKLSFSQLRAWANEIAIGLSKITKPGDFVILSFPAGLEFIACFYACLQAGIIAVPVAHPSNRKHHWSRVKKICDDCHATLFLTTESAVLFATEHLEDSKLPQIMGLKNLDKKGTPPKHTVKSTDIAYLQYTSGSTSDPKGVIMTHQNVLHNVTAIASGFSLNDSDVVVSWLPHHHDQGLVGIILVGLWVGIPVVLMAPMAFLQNPFNWLQAISRYRGSYSGGPNFGFSFCVEKHTEEKCKDLDLSSWKVAFNGAEPIRSDTLNDFAELFSKVGFSATALAPCYGLAEATLAVSLTPKQVNHLQLRVDKDSLEKRQWKLSENGIELVSSGRIIGQQTVVIVDPKNLQESPVNHIGEIWISGPSVAMGYWENQQQSIKNMGLSLANHAGKTFLRSGDLGYLHDGELFVVGRIKDVIIIRGRNHYPQDIELTVSQTSNAFRHSGCAAFSCKIDGSSQLIVVQEIERVSIKKFDPIEARRQVIEQITSNHDIKAHQILFIRPLTLPKTSSGKVQRSRTKQMFTEGTLSTIKEQKGKTHKIKISAHDEQSKLGEIASEIIGESVDINASLLSLGFDSIELIRFKQAVESKLSASLPLELLFEKHSIFELENQLDHHQNKTNINLTPQIVEVDDSIIATNQQSLWLAQTLQPHSGVFNLSIPFKLNNSVDKKTLNSAWQTCLQRHPLLTMSIKDHDGAIKLIAGEQQKIIFHPQDTPIDSDELIKNIRNLAQTPVDLNQPRLSSVHCWQQGSSQVLCFIIHHVLVDMWSLLNVLDEFLLLISGQSPSNIPIPYSEYVAQSNKKTEKTENDLNYWKKKFQNNSPQVLRLPGNPLRPEKRLGDADSLYLTIDKKHTDALKKIAQHQATTLHTTLLAVYAMVLMRYSGQSEINIGGPTSGRNDSRFNDTVGFFVNTVVYQIKNEPNSTFLDFLETVMHETRKVIQHQHTQFSEVVKIADIPPTVGIHPLYQTSFTLQKSHRLTCATPMIVNGPTSQHFSVYDLEVSTVPMPAHSCQVDIALTMVESEGRLEGRLDFATDVLNRQLIKSLVASLEQVMCQLPNNLSKETEGIAIQKKTSPIHDVTYDFQTCDTFLSVNQVLQKNILAFAAQTAIIHHNEKLQYHQLATRTAQMVGHLKRLNVSQGHAIVLACSRSPYWVSTLLAIWQIGAIYVPIDDNIPKDRAINILDQVSPQLVLVEDDRLDFYPERVDIKQLDETNDSIETVVPVAISSKDPAYIIFTSGTTGLPKGVIVNHGSLSNRLNWITKNIPLKKGERVLHKTPTSFDVSLWECLWPLYSGATSVIADDITRKNPIELAEMIRLHQVSTTQFVPSFLSVFLDSAQDNWPQSLSRIICGGEELTSDLVKKLDLKSMALHNLYGPTESGFVTHQKINGTTDVLTLGQSISNTQVMILDTDDRPTPPGAIGEMVVFGQAVGLGYLQPTGTEVKFGQTKNGHRYYRTGDMAEYTEDGQIKFLGRKDRQIKLRGFRIELQEIESILLKHPKVIACHCSVVGEDALAQLIAWVHSTQSDLSKDLQYWCKKLLPAYMSPDQISVLEQWPLTAHGKLNTALLPKNIDNAIKNNNERPIGPFEEALADIWAKLLNQKPIYRETHFFSSGGHSLLAAIMANRIKEKYDVTPDVQLIFREPMMKNYAQALIDLFPEKLTISDEHNDEDNDNDEKEEFVI